MQGGKMAAIINYRVRVTLNDSRALVGQLLAFDKHMNLVLAECDEFRRIKRKGGAKAAKPAGGAEDAAEGEDDEDEMKRTLGLVILRGETIVSLSGAFNPR
jgi:small nuclear ribonucleoprotein B and B'